MTEADLYFGRPGSLEVIPHPRGGVISTRVRQRSRFDTSAGGARLSTIVGGKRQYSLAYDRLLYTDFAILQAYDQGEQGPGPFALIDPAVVNMLTPNQASTTAETNDSSNFTVSGSGGTLTSESTTIDRGPRSLAWNFTFAASGSLWLDSPSTQWTGVPVITSTGYTFWVTAKGGGTDAIMTLTAQIWWYTAAGVFISTTSGTPLVTSSSAWQIASVTGTSPATAAFGKCCLTNTGTSAGSILYIGRCQLQPSTGVTPVATDWRPGLGPCPVGVYSLVEHWPWYGTGFREQIQFIVLETGP